MYGKGNTNPSLEGVQAGIALMEIIMRSLKMLELIDVPQYSDIPLLGLYSKDSTYSYRKMYSSINFLFIKP